MKQNDLANKRPKIVLKGGNGNRTAKDAKKIQYGLGIDAGGTYTDAVVFDFQTNRLKCKNKALTTKWDFTRGIRSALFGLDHDILEKVELVAVSTTLATNTMVEGEGRPVGLLLMPPHDKFDIDDIPMRLMNSKTAFSNRADWQARTLMKWKSWWMTASAVRPTAPGFFWEER